MTTLSENDGSSTIIFSSPDISDEDVAAVERVLRSGWLTSGGQCVALEQELVEYLGVSQAVAVSSCTAALEIAFAWLSLPVGARVGVPTWTFVSSALAPYHWGSQPVLLDIEPDSLNLAPEALEAALDDGLDAVVAVHFGGVPVAREIHELCAAYEVPLVEDAAHAFGASDHRGLLRGTGSVCAAFSFYVTKNLCSGEGGALTTENNEFADFARSFRLHGLSQDAWNRYTPGARRGYDLLAPGIKGNLPDLLAVLARSQLARFDALQARRRAIMRRYRGHVASMKSVRMVPQELVEDGADHLAVVVLPEGADRDRVVAAFAAARIGTSVHFRPLHHMAWFADRAVLGRGGTPVADILAPRVFSLPLHPGLTDADVDRICDLLDYQLT